jgi:hypothetical protein
MALLSCSKQEPVTPAAPAQKVAKEVTYIYKGESIKVDFTAKGDSLLPIRGGNTEKMEKIFSIPTLTKYINSKHQDVVYLYDSYKEFEAVANKSAKLIPDSPGRSTTQPGRGGATNRTDVGSCGPPPYFLQLYNYIIAYRDDYYVGDTYLITYTTADPNYYCGYNVFASTMSSISGVNWNDQISSLRVNNTCPPTVTSCGIGIRLTFWTSEYYDGTTLVFEVDAGNTLDVPSISNYTYGGGFFSSKKNWNDEASSLQVIHYIR